MSLKFYLHCVGMSKNDIVTIAFDYAKPSLSSSVYRLSKTLPLPLPLFSLPLLLILLVLLPHLFLPPQLLHESVTQQEQQAATESEYKLPCMILNWDSIKLLICSAVSLEESPERPRSELMTAQENN